MKESEQEDNIQWTPAVIKSQARTEHGRKRLAQLAAEGSRHFVSASETLITGNQRPKPDEASKLALDILKRYPGGEVALADTAVEAGVATAGLLERVAARAAMKTGEPDIAIRLRRAAVALEPEQSHRYIALAHSLQGVTATGIVYDPLVGLSEGRIGKHAVEIVKLLEAARKLNPSSTFIQFQLGISLLRDGQAYDGLLLLERAALRNPNTEWLTELAEAYRRPDIARFADAFDAYEDVINLAPRNSKALAGLINTGARGPMNWTRMWRNVLKYERSRKASPFKGNADLQHWLEDLFRGTVEPEDEAVRTLVSMLEEESGQRGNLSSHALNMVILRLQFLGHFSAGFQLRAQLANTRRVELRRSGIKNINGLRQYMKALVYLDRHESARDISADFEYWAKGDPGAHLAVKKLHVDALLMSGEMQPYVRYSEEAHRAVFLNGESLMKELIDGKRVAVVGPAATKDRLGKTIDEYDVVVRPNFNPEVIASNPESMGRETDIAYYSGQDMTKLIDDVDFLVKTSGVKLINTRSFSYQAHNRSKVPWLRFSRHDWSLSFHGSPLGIQRIIYDLLQFNPQEIGIFNSDFYTGDGEFVDGYRGERSFGPGSFKNDLLVVHDLLMDFKFTQAMLRTGRVTAHGRASEVLSQEPSVYLETVESAGVLQ